MGTPVPQAFCTATDIFELGIGQNALRQLTAKHIRSAIRAKSSGVATALRKRHLLPLVHSLVEWDTSAMTTATASWVGTPDRAADVTIEVGAGGSVRAALDQLQSGQPDFGPAIALDASGSLLVAGVTITFSGTLTAGNRVTFRSEVEGCVREATALLAAHVLLHVRGLDPNTMETLKLRRDEAMAELDAWAEGNKRELPPDADASPTVDEGGSIGDGQQDPWDWQDAQP